MRCQAADIGQRVDLDAQQIELRAVPRDHFERNVAEAQKAHGIAGIDKAVDEGCLDLIEIAFNRSPRLLRIVGRLPLRCRSFGRAVVSRSAVIVVMVVTMIVTVVVVMVMIVTMAMAVLASALHGALSS